ncbi:MAG: hypothetical protein ACOWYE_01460 [Desulfatiglandales bacterium]
MIMKWAKLRRAGSAYMLMILVFMTILLFAAEGGCHFPMRSVGHHFEYEDFEKNGDGFNITIVNKSKQGFSELKIVVLGTDIDWVTVYRREIEVEFFEGEGKKTFFLPGYDERVYDINLRIYMKTYEAYE